MPLWSVLLTMETTINTTAIKIKMRKNKNHKAHHLNSLPVCGCALILTI